MVVGKFGISATVICDSVSAGGVRLMTFELTYPRLILSELNTHRMLSKNSASSRAIPFKKMTENLTGRPVRFGGANSGMQDMGVDLDVMIVGRPHCNGENSPTDYDILAQEEAWEDAKADAVFWSEAFYSAGYAKQVYNRLTEPFQMMKTVLSGTELENFFWLRDDGAADPTIAELARCMREARDASTPQELKAGEWHLPYVDTSRDAAGKLHYWEYVGKTSKVELNIENAIKVSCSRSAAVSFRNTDYGLEKCKEVYDRLVGDERKHASALEHPATPMISKSVEHFVNMTCYSNSWQQGISHADRNGQLWSGNFRGFIQFRKTVDGENKPG